VSTTADTHAERTAQAWQRTGLTAAAVGVLAARTVSPAAGVALVAAGVLAAALVAPLRYARLRTGAAPVAPALVLVAALVPLLAAAALAGPALW
jgi:hypothetical protein